jgi:predicted permease
VDEEFAFHLDQLARELVGRGWAPDDARREARRRFGDLDDARDYCRRLGRRRERRLMRLERLQALRHDLVLALRGLRRSPGFALAAVLTLALGVGANVTMFDVADRLLLRPPPGLRAPGELRRLYFSAGAPGEDDTPGAMVGWPQLVALRETFGPARPAAGFALYRTAIGEGEGVQDAQVTLAAGDYFALLGVRPALGRTFGSAEDAPPAGTRVAVIAHELWRTRFGGAPDVVGRPLTIAGLPFTVVGVAPPGFTGVDAARVDAWVPASALAQRVIGPFAPDGWERAANVGWLRTFTRVRDDRAGDVAAATAGATRAYRQVLTRRHGAAGVDSLRPRATLAPLLLERGPERTPNARLAVWLAGMSVVVFVIACANVANLLLARAVRRRREQAVRAALGAGRGRLAAQLLTESAVLTLLGGAGAVLVATWGGAFVRRTLLPDVAWDGGAADPRLLAFAALGAVAAGLLTGLAPALQAGRAPVAAALRTGAREGGGRRAGVRNALVVLQAALSLLLLVGAGLFVQSLRRALAVDLGYAADQVLAVSVDLAGAGFRPAEAVAAYDRMHERVAALPGVRAASLAVTEPFSTTLDVDVGLPGRDSVPLPSSGPPRANAVTPEFFAAMGTPILRGRGVLPSDVRGAAPVVVVNETMARHLWPGREALGECVVLREETGRPCAQVVGVARDARWAELREPAPMQMYLALRQGLMGSLPLRVLFVRGAGDPAALVASVRRAVLAESPGSPRVRVRPLAVNLDSELRPWRLGATMLSAFGALALALAALGLYAVIAYDAAQRTRELGVRQALGARSRDLVRLVVAHGVRIAAVGVALGVAAALAVGRWVGPMLFDTGARDPRVIGGVAALLLFVAALAGAVPAWRAARVPPGAALRAE